jgi:hypothetical protein
METGKSSVRSFHLAGIVPVAAPPLEFNFPWHDSLMPIANDYLAVERAVVECAVAGCETIWIVCHKNMQPLIRHRIGEKIDDPVCIKKMMFQEERRRPIQIYYVPIHPKDQVRRDCLGWSVLYGAYVAHAISRKISKWVVPDRYYASFPYGILDHKIVREHRHKISNKNRFFFSHNDRTVLDGDHLSFTFSGDDFIKVRRAFRTATRSCYFKSMEEGLPPDERVLGKEFSLDKMFKSVIIDDNDVIVELPWFYNIDTWEGFCEYAGSKYSREVQRPDYLKYREWNPIGLDREDEEQ